jgi:hypothetical protein
MGRIVRLTERDLTRLVRRVIKEHNDHNTMVWLADELTPHGFVKMNGGNSKLGPYGEFNVLTKGDDDNGASIYKSIDDMKVYLNVQVGGVSKVHKEYPMSEPDYLVDDKQILKDLGNYKTYNFKKTPNRG